MGCPPRTVTLVFAILGMIGGAGTILRALAAFSHPSGAGQILSQIFSGALAIGLGYFGYNAIINDRAGHVKLYALIHNILNILFIIGMVIAILIFLGFLMFTVPKDHHDMPKDMAIIVLIILIVVFAIVEPLNLWHIKSAYATAELISQKQIPPIYSNLHV